MICILGFTLCEATFLRDYSLFKCGDDYYAKLNGAPIPLERLIKTMRKNINTLTWNHGKSNLDREIFKRVERYVFAEEI